MKKVWGIVTLMVLIGFGLPMMSLAQDSARELSKKALQECNKGRLASERSVRLAHLERAQALAEQSIQLDDQNPDGHFALFCSMGEKMRTDGEVLSSLFGFQGLLAELDRTLALDPNHLDALSSKGTILIRLPRLLGGDPETGEKMLRRVVREDPTSINARIILAKSCSERGEYKEALELATNALKNAEAQDRQDLLPEAQETFAKVKNSQP